ncbi:hypothetical protein BV20DRAFT_950927 [Pilatotrama ljubarskyi]|nr:hypothetical protein BV20DRAFT_950927 [Pilatotrama ljubarskyi]
MERVSRWFNLKPDNDQPSSKRNSYLRRERASDYRERYRDLEDRLQEKEGELVAERRRGRSLREQLYSSQDTNRALESALKAAEEKGRELDAHAQGLKKRNADLERALKAGDAARGELEKALSQTQTEFRNLKTLLDTRTAELKEAQTYLSKVDDVTDSEVVRLVERINSQIFQTAAKIADDCQGYYGMQKESAIAEAAVSRLEKSSLLAPHLPRTLYTKDHSEDPILVQIALQVALSSFLYHLASPWSTSFEKQTAFLHSIYAEMCKHEPQSVFGRWRAMTLTHMRALIPAQSKVVSMACSRLIEHVCDVLLACGVDSSPDEAHCLVKERYGKALKQIIVHVLDFRRIAGERIVSRDLEVVVAGPSEPFAPESMEDEWAHPKHREGAVRSTGPVFGTTHLGLIKQERKAETGKVAEEGDTVRRVVLVKPKVMLESTLEGLLAEPQGSPE